MLQLKSAYQDGTTHIVMAPLEFMQRLAALVPRPRLHLIPFDRLSAGRFHGVLAPNAKLRSEIIPSLPEQVSEPACDHANAHSAPARMSWARLLKRVFDIDIDHCPKCGGSLKIIAVQPSTKGCHRRSAGDRQNSQPSGPAHPRPAARASAAIRSIPDNLRCPNRLPTQANGGARSEFERAARSGTLRAPATAAPSEPAEATLGFSDD